MANKIIQNIVGGSRQSDINKVCKALSVNMYQETQDPSQAYSPSIMRSIYGSSVAMDIGVAGCRGLYRVSRAVNGYEAMYACFGNKVYFIQYSYSEERYTKYEVGTVSNGNGHVRMVEVGGGSSDIFVVIVDGACAYAVNASKSPAEQAAGWLALKLPKREDGITDIVPTHCAYLYGYLAINDAGTDAFYLSYQYPFEELYNGSIDMDVFQTEERWGFDGKGFKVYSEWMPDNTIALISNGSYLWTFGSRSYQCFSYNGDTNYPFSSPDNAAGAIGIRAEDSLAGLGTSVFWLGSSDIGQNGIYMSDGTAAKRISNPDMERQIARMTNPNDAKGQCWQENQHIFYAISFISDNVTFVYDVSEGIWHNRESYNGATNATLYWRNQYACFFDNKVFFGILNDSKLIYLDMDKWTEYDGTMIVRKRIGGVIYNDYSPFYIDCLRLIVNNGQVRNGGNPEVSIRYSWDGATWSEKETGCLGNAGEYDYNTDYWQLGMGTCFSVEVTFTDNEDFAIISAKVNPSGANIF